MTHTTKIDFIIAACLADKATKEEAEYLENWIKVSPDNLQYYQECLNIWQLAHPAFGLKTIDVSSAEKKVMKQINKTSVFIRFFVYWQRIAAVLVIPLFIMCVYFLVNKSAEMYSEIDYQEIKAPHGTFSQIKLPDGTDVWLNGGSSLKYPILFKHGERKVVLNGEGYFEVRADKENPFIVETRALRLVATGTAFNIEAYEKDSLTAVTMVIGKVDVTFNRSAPIALKPGERANYNNVTNKCKIIPTEPYKWYAWKDGLMIFRDDPLEYVFKRLGQTFNVDIQIKDSGIANALYRATFEEESLEQILHLLELTAPIRFELHARGKLANNYFEKQRIEVYKRSPEFNYKRPLRSFR